MQWGGKRGQLYRLRVFKIIYYRKFLAYWKVNKTYYAMKRKLADADGDLTSEASNKVREST